MPLLWNLMWRAVGIPDGTFYFPEPPLTGHLRGRRTFDSHF
jgi:hypothetical protein